jgi:hypothetical protein
MSPAIKSLGTASFFNDAISGKCEDLTECLDALADCIDRAKAGNLGGADVMLVSQVHALDSAFSYLLRKAFNNSEAGYTQAANSYFMLALRCQSQTRCTWETLSKIHNPPAPTFVRQANIANGPQQVNNNDPRTEEFATQPNELKEGAHVVER